MKIYEKPKMRVDNHVRSRESASKFFESHTYTNSVSLLSQSRADLASRSFQRPHAVSLGLKLTRAHIYSNSLGITCAELHSGSSDLLKLTGVHSGSNSLGLTYAQAYSESRVLQLTRAPTDDGTLVSRSLQLTREFEPK